MVKMLVTKIKKSLEQKYLRKETNSRNKPCFVKYQGSKFGPHKFGKIVES